MSVRVNIQGEIVPPEEAKISVFDRQFLYGDGIYETIRTFRGRPFLLAAHFRRFQRSAEGIGISLPWSDEGLRREIERTLEAAGNGDSTARIVVTRGVGEFGLDPTGIDRPNWLIIVRPLNPPAPELARDGVDVAIPSVRRNSPRAIASHIKSGNYLNQAMALKEGKEHGAYEVVMLDDAGHVTEGSTSNVFWARDGVLFTPSVEAGVLPGVTRALILGLARRLGIPAQRGLWPVDELLAADEAFLTATIKEVLPIRRVVDHRAFSPVPGTVTARMLAAYRELTDRARAGTLSEAEADALTLEGDETI